MIIMKKLFVGLILGAAVLPTAEGFAMLLLRDAQEENSISKIEAAAARSLDRLQKMGDEAHNRVTQEYKKAQERQEQYTNKTIALWEALSCTSDKEATGIVETINTIEQQVKMHMQADQNFLKSLERFAVPPGDLFSSDHIHERLKAYGQLLRCVVNRNAIREVYIAFLKTLYPLEKLSQWPPA